MIVYFFRTFRASLHFTGVRAWRVMDRQSSRGVVIGVEKIWTEVAENEPKTFTADAKQRSLSRECLYGDLSSRKSEPPPRLAYILRVMAAAVSYNRTKSPWGV